MPHFMDATSEAYRGLLPKSTWLFGGFISF